MYFFMIGDLFLHALLHLWLHNVPLGNNEGAQMLTLTFLGGVCCILGNKQNTDKIELTNLVLELLGKRGVSKEPKGAG